MPAPARPAVWADDRNHRGRGHPAGGRQPPPERLEQTSAAGAVMSAAMFLPDMPEGLGVLASARKRVAARRLEESLIAIDDMKYIRAHEGDQLWRATSCSCGRCWSGRWAASSHEPATESPRYRLCAFPAATHFSRVSWWRQDFIVSESAS
ncbi:MAG: hypothetical protein HQ464_04940 [Planctomycetes bacterium]|nr:hypothetical protein [Planctomycetota bacterium]